MFILKRVNLNTLTPFINLNTLTPFTLTPFTTRLRTLHGKRTIAASYENRRATPNNRSLRHRRADR